MGHRLTVLSSLVTKEKAGELYPKVKELIKNIPELDIYCSMVYADDSELCYKPEQLRPEKTRADLIQEKIAAMRERQAAKEKPQPLKLSRKEKKRRAKAR